MKLIIILLLCLLVTPAYATIYVCIDKETGDPVGTADISPLAVQQWAALYNLKEAGESYRGLQGYEIKIQGNSIRKATAQEIQTYLNNQKAEQEEMKKKDALDTLGLDAKDISKIKKLPDDA